MSSELAALTAIYETTRSLGISESLESLLDDILARTEELIDSDHCALSLIDEGRRELVVAQAHGYAGEDVVGMRIGLDEGLAGWSVRNRESIRVGDVREDSRYIPGLPDARSNMVVPLIIENRAVGAINVESRREDAFTPEHEKLLTVLGTQAALAIVASRARGRLQQRVEHLDALYRISRQTWTDKSFDEVIDAVLDEVHRILPRAECAVLILDPDQGTLIVRGHRGYRDDVLGLEIEIGEGVSGRCAATGEVQVVDDVSEDPDYIPGLPDAASEVAVPLIHQGEVIGVLNAESEQEDAFDEAARRLLSVVGRQVATVLAATRLQEENRRLAVTDGLTGLHNRRYFERRLAEAVERAERYGERLALVYIDLDRFKAVNDSHGHPVGDLVLRRTAGALEDRCRGSDLLARIGGEEFAVLLFRVGRSKARGIADRLRRAIEALEIDAEGVEEPLTITVSAGVALYPDHGPGLEELHRTADMALYRSKEAGRNRVTVYD